jgi:DNA-binding CsgD family transcriptional regulator
VALTYGAAEPAARRRLAAEAEAALGRAGGALRPGVSPRLAWLNCLAFDGRWDEALRILDGLPPPGNAHLRREMTDTRAVLARCRGEPEVAWAQIRPLFPEGPATEPGDIIHQEGLFLQRLAAELCLDAGDLPGAQTWLEAHDAWLAWSGSVLGRAEALAARLSAQPSAAAYPAGLTEREVEVLRLLPRGLSNAEIAEALFVSPRTVQTHLTNLYGKLGVGGRAEAVAFAMAHGLV